MGNFIKQFFDIKFWKFILVGILNTVVGMGLQSLNLHSILQYATDLPTELQFRSSVCSVRQTAGQCSAGVLKSLQATSQ